MLVTTAIPIYKAALSAMEARSFERCLTMLHRYPIALVAPESLDVSWYEEQFEAAESDYRIIRFDDRYFVSVEMYSRLLLTRTFYLAFAEYDYLFIYQTDAYVFSDELEEWCRKGYDYIGSPWFSGYRTHESGAKLYKVGNGGVSLRRVAAFLGIFDKRMPFALYPFYVRNIRKIRFMSMLIDAVKMKFMIVFTNRNVEYYLQHFTDERINEDCFWADGLSSTKLALKVPDILEAAHFSIEKSPSYLYRLIGERLPFSCHAYEKYEYDTFWRRFIK